jgi:hypothetical protein
MVKAAMVSDNKGNASLLDKDNFSTRVKAARVSDDKGNRQMIVPTTMLSSLLAGISLRAQVGRGPAVHAPEVYPGGKVAFRLRAPGAKWVAASLSSQRVAMGKDGQGSKYPPPLPATMEATTEAPHPDLHAETFSADGANINDPGNRLFESSYGGASQSISG